jgi:hypothetical protein
MEKFRVISRYYNPWFKDSNTLTGIKYFLQERFCYFFWRDIDWAWSKDAIKETCKTLNEKSI